ncbi:hypothetical protein BWK57_12815 [Flavobacterium columnare]|uniref:hypothetical protein n=1 Tax=Flavobacterium columnare TaxID=996 RepID=UPI000CDA2A4D|nr:hypothetical protein [Flavobacterium columnare]POR20665.1 hypothetical protein BWK57_12815 [Flavobacterium columnare]
MQKQIYFKIIELENYQVLVEKCFDDDDETEAMNVSFHIKGMKVSYNLSYETMEKRDNDFEQFDKKQAQKFIDSIRNFLKY